jgi:hypothetical protein
MYSPSSITVQLVIASSAVTFKES